MEALFPTGTLSVNALTRDIASALRKVPVEDLVRAIESISSAIAAREPIEDLAIPSFDAHGVGPSARVLLVSCIGDVTRSELSESAVREWWESAGLDTDRAHAVANALSRAAPVVAARFQGEGALYWINVTISRSEFTAFALV